MNVRILQLIEGAKQATGLTVIIDVFRAFSLEAYMFQNGVKTIFPVGSIETAYALKEKYEKANPGQILLAGERHGMIQPGFDMGNSPSQLSRFDLAGKTVIHTTSAGTQGIANAVHAEEILGTGLVNARATAAYIQRRAPEEVSLVCMGLEGKTPTEEDVLCARYIKSILEGSPIALEDEIENLKVTSGAKFFDPAQSQAFPEQDFYLCTKVDIIDLVVKLEKGTDGPEYMVSIKEDF